MRVVSDSDVIIHAHKLDVIWLFKKLYGRVLIPEYVLGEILHRDVEQISIAIGEGVLEARKTDESRAAEIASKYKIHIGEANVKALAEEIKADLLLSNERKVRNAAKEESFTVVGIIGIVLRSMRDGHIQRSTARKLLEEMRSRNREFRIHPDILSKAVAELDEL